MQHDHENLNISDYDYDLPAGRIAKFPLAERDASRLLVWTRLTRASESEATCETTGKGSETVFQHAVEQERDGLGDCEFSRLKTEPVEEGAERKSPEYIQNTREVRSERTGEGLARKAQSTKQCLSETIFRNIGDFLPTGSTLVFNDTRVVRARLTMFKSTGARVEILCLEPHSPADYGSAFAAKGKCEWSVMIGGAKKWKSGSIEIRDERGEVLLSAWRVGENIVKFEWDGSLTFGELLEELGRVPIPPYLDRDTQEIDVNRYQTVYASTAGSVAAPTAGLHFTEELIAELTNPSNTRLSSERVTLHVGAGTFLPVKTEDALEHPMHTEHLEVTLGTVERLATKLLAGEKIIAVGTTSVRTLESLAMLGWRLASKKFYSGHGGGAETSRTGAGKPIATVEAAKNPSKQQITVDQFAWRDIPEEFDGAQALETLADWMRGQGLETLRASTQIMITPGYRFRIVSGLVTNFHQPKSTLLLLVSAFVGDTYETASALVQAADGVPTWREIYDYALEHDFRFLSYGDSSLLLP